MKVGVFISTFERPEYLAKTLDSLKQANLNGVNVLIVDDCSTNEETIQLIKESPYSVLIKDSNRGIPDSIITGYETLFSEGCELVINLDSDVLVKPYFIEKIKALHEKYPDSIITGFNSLSKHSKGIVRHPIIETKEDCYFKNSCGGVNMAMNQATFKRFVLPSCQKVIREKKGNWDTEACKIAAANKKPIVVTKGSVVQHIGLESSMGHNEEPCIGIDFNEQQKEDIIINQFFGLGDILFCIEIARSYLKKGHKVIWPVEPQFVNIQKHFPEIQFVDKNLLNINYESKVEVSGNGFRIIPLRWSQNILGLDIRDCMKSKYMMFGRDWNDWHSLTWKRDNKSEDVLFDMLGLQEGEKYILVNRWFKTNARPIDIRINPGFKVVEMRNIPGFTLLDWVKVMENAFEIHTVSTSIIYIFEMIKLNARAVCIYIRTPEERDHKNYDYILTDKHKYLLK